jgi:hypothetical protein
VIVFARDVTERDRCKRQHREYLTTLPGVRVLSALDLEALPPFDGVARESAFDMTIPKRPVRKRIKGLPSFTTIRGGAYFFLPGIRALRSLASGEMQPAS